MITAKDMQELAQKKNEAFDKYNKALREFTLERLRPAVDVAELDVEVQANAETRTPYVVMSIFDEDLFGRTGGAQVRISVYELLQCPQAALSKAAGWRGQGSLGLKILETKFPPKKGYAWGFSLDGKLRLWQVLGRGGDGNE